MGWSDKNTERKHKQWRDEGRLIGKRKTEYQRVKNNRELSEFGFPKKI